METLGFGSHLIIDGYAGNSSTLADESRLQSVLETLAARLEATATPTLVLAALENGTSAAMVLGEAQLALHLYPDRGTLSLDVFSPRGLEVQTFLDTLREGYGLGRLESHLVTRSKLFPREAAALRASLLGDRAYSGARLDETLLL